MLAILTSTEAIHNYLANARLSQQCRPWNSRVLILGKVKEALGRRKLAHLMAKYTSSAGNCFRGHMLCYRGQCSQTCTVTLAYDNQMMVETVVGL